MSTFKQTTPREIKKLTEQLCCRKVTNTRKVIGKSIQTIRQYQADYRSSASRLMPAADMIKLAIYHDQMRFAFGDGGEAAQRMIDTGVVPPLPSYVDAAKTRTKPPELNVAYNKDGDIICRHKMLNFAQQAADVVGGYVKKFTLLNVEISLDLAEDQKLRSRFRRMYFSGEMDIDIACELMEIDLYGMLPFFREYPYPEIAPDPSILEAILVQSAFKQIEEAA